ncbi:hypothetical protein IEO21_03187 [Rhodonia placenta]|uniref:Guanine nucleotide-binding protein subunit gamma n=1 Tax=Rhodonia placenta TaxID=104341 RepID=A0A8H7P6D5_9APHY|nr:hypothetical protein IEO21_03187 [Postia placenta]
MSSRQPKVSSSELKLRRLNEHNQRLREDLARPRIRVSEASVSLIRYCKTTKDYLSFRRSTHVADKNRPALLMGVSCSHLECPLVALVLGLRGNKVPSVWGTVSKAEDPFGAAPQSTGCGCVVM